MEDRDTIQKRMLEGISDEYDKSKGSFFYDSTKVTAIEFEKKGLDIEELKKGFDIENLSGVDLEKRVYQETGTIRKPATHASTIVDISGQPGTTVPIGTAVSSDIVTFKSTEEVILNDLGVAKVKVECEVLGSEGNIPVGSIRYFPITVNGLAGVINLEPVTNGYDAEPDKELLERHYERRRTPATSGNKYHYMNWAKEFVGVGDAKVVSLWAGNNTVKVIIIDSLKHPAGADLIKQVQDYIDPKGEHDPLSDTWSTWGQGEGEAPVGAFCTVISAAPKQIDIDVTVTKDGVRTIESIKDDIERNISDYLKSIAFKSNIASYAQIGAAILNVQGVLDYRGLKINSGTENIAIGNEEVAVLGGVTIAE
ncbi:baseplate J-like protein [Andreesenia angusta]|uniref:Baseplate J-like protein n=1 Tax=Andreesenia angusta TaxID=39480 RepID=A0A1S1VAP2_9FIRM|nr:baseplate J/gp47 family protein [Andreesenia angusta]OHW62899.1 baseplate J-like protein [Andreesenia angusta]